MTAPRTVLQLLHNLEVGGAQQVVVDLAAALLPRGRYRPVVCAWRRGGPVEQSLSRLGVVTDVLSLPRRSAWLAPLFVRDAARVVGSIVRVARRENASLLQTHLSDSAFWGVLAARRLGCPMVMTIHSNNPLPHDLTGGHRLVRRALLAWAARQADLVVTVSQKVKDSLRAETGVPAERVEVVNNGIPLPAPERRRDRDAVRAALGIPAASRVLTCVGRLVSHKGQDILVRMMPRLLPGFPDLRLLLVGDGPFRADLVPLVAQLGLSEHVHFAGERSDVARLLDASDVFVSASHYEGISLAMLEAMAAGLPVVASCAQGHVEVLDGGAGLLVPTLDAGDFAATLTRVLADRGLAASLAAAAERRVREHFSMDRVVAQMHAIYDRLLVEPTGRPAAEAVAR